MWDPQRSLPTLNILWFCVILWWLSYASLQPQVMHLRYLRHWRCQIFSCLTVGQYDFYGFDSRLVGCLLWLMMDRVMTCWGAVCELLDCRSSTWLSMSMQDRTWWCCVLPAWFHYQLEAIYDGAATPSFLPAYGIPVRVSQCFLCTSLLAFQVQIDWKIAFFSQKPKLSVGSVSYCDTCCSCLRSRPIGSDTVGLLTSSSPISHCWWLDQCRWTRRMPIKFWLAVGHKMGLYPWNHSHRKGILCACCQCSALLSSLQLSVLLRIYRQVWKEIQIGLYFTQHQNGKSISLAENQSEVRLKWNVFSLVLLLTDYFIHVGEWQIWC